MKKLFNLFVVFALVGSFFGIWVEKAEAAAPTVTFLINGSSSSTPINNPGSVNLSWSSSGATECVATGTAQTGWTYGNVALSGSGSYSWSSWGITYYVLTCKNSVGETTTLTRAVNVGFGPGANCDVFPEVTGADITMTVTNLTSGATSTVYSSRNSSTNGPDLPVANGDQVLIEYEVVNGTFGNDNYINMNSSSQFYFGSSVATSVTGSISGSFVVRSAAPGYGAGVDVNMCNGGGAATGAYVSFVTAPGDFTISCTPPTATITAGSSTSFNLSTTPVNGFSSPVTFSAAVSPTTGTIPAITFVNNNQVPPAVTAAMVNTTASTTPATYTVTFSANSGSITKTCNVQLVVNAQPTGAYTLTVTPDPHQVIKGNNAVFTVAASCAGGATGPITGLSATSPFLNLTYNFSSTTVNCNGSVTLTVGNTSSIGSDQYSTPQQRLEQTITVTGQGSM